MNSVKETYSEIQTEIHGLLKGAHGDQTKEPWRMIPKTGQGEEKLYHPDEKKMWSKGTEQYLLFYVIAYFDL